MIVMDSKEGLGIKTCIICLDLTCWNDIDIVLIEIPCGRILSGNGGWQDLLVVKGGTLGFGAERENAEFEAWWEKSEKEESAGKPSEDGDKKRENE